ncbi:hypothetical protein GE061_001444 [Apolygus lucorum]|uniref:Peptidase C1A papain C-terminal domain-containing protein n=1 Tax=Apolygus lucorum TaxID=248454 RepID=A0A8S9Y9Q8_APOLU|nr:hypothetical protein GE061_001444 [Apolygus lucorum]
MSHVTCLVSVTRLFHPLFRGRTGEIRRFSPKYPPISTMKSALLLQVVIVVIHHIGDAVGQRHPPRWIYNQPFSVSWTMDQVTNDGKKFNLQVRQSYSLERRMLRWDIPQQYSYMIWSLEHQQVLYVFPRNARGDLLQYMVNDPFQVNTRGVNIDMSIAHPNLSKYVLDQYSVNPPYYTWFYDVDNYRSVVEVKEIPGQNPEIVSASVYEMGRLSTVTRFYDYVYGEPEEDLWITTGTPWRTAEGTKEGELQGESVLQNYLLGDASIWPYPAHVHPFIDPQHQNNLSASRSLVNHSTPFPYSKKECDSHPYPQSLDWSRCGAVGDVRDQVQCSGCSSFTGVSVMESAHYIHTGERVDLAVQAALDCGWDAGNEGCFAGFPRNVFDWAINNGGVPSTRMYGGFRKMNGKCKSDSDKRFLAARITSWTQIPKSVNALKMILLRHGPVAAGVTTHDLLHYNGDDIIRAPGGSRKITHAGQIVGWDTSPSGVPYWKVKNSWGTDWGNRGYYAVEISEELNPLRLLDDMVYVNMDHDARKGDTYCNICGFPHKSYHLSQLTKPSIHNRSNRNWASICHYHP